MCVVVRVLRDSERELGSHGGDADMPGTRPRVLVTIEMAHLPEARAVLEQGAEVTYLPEPSDADLVGTIGGYDAVVTNLQQKIGRDVIDAGERLRVIATPSTGTDHIDLAYAEARGLTVQSIKADYDVLKHITATAEHAFMLMMACLRGLPFAFDMVREGRWEREPFRGREVQGRVCGILGYGRLGEIFSRFAHAFEMEVLACDPCKTISDPWVRQVDLDTLLRESEVITIHIHLTEETTRYIGEREFSLMRDGVYLVNTSRGKIVDEEAFVRALDSGKVAAAGVDVISTELDGIIVDNPLVAYARTHSNLIITPHIGGFTLDSQHKAFVHMATKLAQELTGRT